ncbi:hypothetical protein QEN19_002013 [Hanseniaspora menglaensis]
MLSTKLVALNKRSVRFIQSELPVKPIVDMKFDLHLPKRSVIGKLPYHVEEPIVFVHGLFGSKKNYFQDCAKLANLLQTPIYTVDIRNHGETEHALPFDYNTISNDLIHFIKKHNLQNPSLIGYSLGAKVSMLSLLREPTMFKSAMIIDNSPVDQPEILPFLRVFRKSCAEVVNKANISANDKEYRANASKYMSKFIPNTGIRGYLLNNCMNTKPKYESPVINYDDGKIHWKNPVNHMAVHSEENVSTWPATEEGAQFNGPVGFLRGTKSDFVLQKGRDAIQKYFPNNKIYDINATHFILNERPQEYVGMVADWFKVGRHEVSKLESKKKAEQAKL